jgi:rubrerythrin
MANKTSLHRYKDNLQDEVDSAALYRELAKAETQPGLSRVYERLAEVEEKHTRFWEEKLRAPGEAPGSRRTCPAPQGRLALQNAGHAR